MIPDSPEPSRVPSATLAWRGARCCSPLKNDWPHARNKSICDRGSEVSQVTDANPTAGSGDTYVFGGVGIRELRRGDGGRAAIRHAWLASASHQSHERH